MIIYIVCGSSHAAVAIVADIAGWNKCVQNVACVSVFVYDGL